MITKTVAIDATVAMRSFWLFQNLQDSLFSIGFVDHKPRICSPACLLLVHRTTLYHIHEVTRTLLFYARHRRYWHYPCYFWLREIAERERVVKSNALVPGEDRFSERTQHAEIQHVRSSSSSSSSSDHGRSETAGDLECLGTFHKLKLLKMKFVIGKKRGASRF